MPPPTTGLYLNQTVPAVPSGNQAIVFQSDGATPEQSSTGYPQIATDTLLGVVKPDGTSITIDGTGTISADLGEIFGGGGSTPAFVQGATNWVTSSLTISKAFVADNVAGSCLIVDVVIVEGFGGADTYDLSDSQGNTYTAVIDQEQNNIRAITYVALDCAAGANTVTLTCVSGSINPNLLLALHEYSNVVTASALDATGFAQAATSTGLPITPSLVTTVAGDLLHLFSACEDTATLTNSGGWTSRESYLAAGGTGSITVITNDEIAGAPGTVSNTVNATYSGSPVYFSAYLIALMSAVTAAGVVTSLNGLTGAVVIDAGAGIALTTVGNTITLGATGAVPVVIPYVPIDAVPGSTYTLPGTMQGFLGFFINGLLQRIGPGMPDGTISGNVITLTNSTVEKDQVYALIF